MTNHWLTPALHLAGNYSVLQLPAKARQILAVFGLLRATTAERQSNSGSDAVDSVVGFKGNACHRAQQCIAKPAVGTHKSSRNPVLFSLNTI